MHCMQACQACAGRSSARASLLDQLMVLRPATCLMWQTCSCGDQRQLLTGAQLPHCQPLSNQGGSDTHEQLPGQHSPHPGHELCSHTVLCKRLFVICQQLHDFWHIWQPGELLPHCPNLCATPSPRAARRWSCSYTSQSRQSGMQLCTFKCLSLAIDPPCSQGCAAVQCRSCAY